MVAIRNTSRRKREANDILRELIGERVDRDVHISFVCECDDERCLEPVELPAVRYDALRFDSEWRPLGSVHARARSRATRDPRPRVAHGAW